MLEIRRGADRFVTRTDWLTSWHSFSYGSWYDADNVGFGPLVVLNQDVLAPGAGFDEHRHSGVNLVTCVVSGALEHHDSLGHAAVCRAGEVQVLCSGSGLTHSERNASATEPVEYVQMWLRTEDTVPSYAPPQPAAQWGGVVDHGADLTIGAIPANASTPTAEGAARFWYVIDGGVRSADGTELQAGDAISGDGDLRLVATEPSLLARFTF